MAKLNIRHPSLELELVGGCVEEGTGNSFAQSSPPEGKARMVKRIDQGFERGLARRGKSRLCHDEICCLLWAISKFMDSELDDRRWGSEDIDEELWLWDIVQERQRQEKNEWTAW